MRKILLAGFAAASFLGAASGAMAQPERWGHWDPTWGPDPGPPPPGIARHWRHREVHWYEHVHRCMVHKGYDVTRDGYLVGRRWVTCRD
jgi:hypothetical protein